MLFAREFALITAFLLEPPTSSQRTSPSKAFERSAMAMPPTRIPLRGPIDRSSLETTR
jgi:hypothetical protein